MCDSDDGKNPFTGVSQNPFEDDVEDEAFLRPSTSAYVFEAATKKSTNPFHYEGDLSPSGGDAHVHSKIDQIQSRSFSSTRRSLAQLMETEIVSDEIARELTGQREQLENCHKKIDDINANLRNSQKHLRRIKSIFGGLKDFLMGVKIKPVKPASPSNEDDSTSRRSSSVRRDVIRLSDLSPPVDVGPKANGDSSSAHPTAMTTNGTVGDFSSAIDNNLKQMLNHVNSLKSRALDLGEELDSQNDLIDTLNDKTEEAQTSMAKQNKDIAKLLK